MDAGELFDRAEWFDTAWRGYRRGQVERHLGELIETAAWERRRAQAAVERLEAAREQLREALGVGEPGGCDGSGTRVGYGTRVEQLIESAEREANRLLAVASRDARELVDRARLDADSHRQRAEAELDARTAEAADELDRRTEELARRKQEVEEILVAARADAERIRSAATRDEQVRLAEAAQHGEELIELAKADGGAGDAVLQADLERFARLRELVGEQLEHLGGLSDGERAAPAGASPAGSDPPGTD